jgi:hypothetical protein
MRTAKLITQMRGNVNENDLNSTNPALVKLRTSMLKASRERVTIKDMWIFACPQLLGKRIFQFLNRFRTRMVQESPSAASQGQ